MKGFVLSAESPVKRSMKLFLFTVKKHVFVVIPNIDIYQLSSACCNSMIEPCYEGGNDNVFVDLFDELGFLESP